MSNEELAGAARLPELGRSFTEGLGMDEILPNPDDARDVVAENESEMTTILALTAGGIALALAAGYGVRRHYKKKGQQ